MTGLDDLRDWLASGGWHIAPDGNGSSDHNLCDWYAYRRSEIPARECECNDGKPMQLVAKPWTFSPPNSQQVWSSVEVSVCGEVGGMWFKLMAYSLKPDEAMDKMPLVESALIAAWNALSIKETP